MDDSMRAEYPAMLANLTHTQAVQVLNDRVKRISKLNIEIADWLQERRKVEEQYVMGLKKLGQFRTPNSQSELGTFQPQWDRILQSTDAIAMAHHVLASKIEKDVEIPLRNFHTRKEMVTMQATQGNLQNMSQELAEAQKKSDSVTKKAGKASAAKMDSASSKLEVAQSQWESQAPFIFETLQALDEKRMNQLRDVLTQYGTYEGEHAQSLQADAEGVLNNLLDYNTGNEIQAFVARTTSGRPKIEKRSTSIRQSSSFGHGSSPNAPPPPSINTPTPAPDEDRADRQSEHSGHREMREEKGESRLRSRIGTMLGRRRQSIHGGFGQLTPSSASKGPFGRTSKSSHGPSPRGSSTNLAETNKLSALEERPDTADEPPHLGVGKHEGTNGISSGDGDAPRADLSQVNGAGQPATGGAPLTKEIAEVAPPPGPPPAQKDEQKDDQGFSIPQSHFDPISAAEKEAAGDEAEPAFKLNIQKEPVAEEDPKERQAAISKFSTSMSTLGGPGRRTGTIRGRRDVRNSIYVPAPVSETAPAQESFSTTTTTSPSTMQQTSSMSSRPPAVAALASEPSMGGTSDTQSIRSSNSLGNAVHFKHPDMYEPGLNSSILETVSAEFEGGELKSAKVAGEIAFSFNPTDPSGAQTIRIMNYPALEAVGPNRIFVTNHHPEHPNQFVLDLNQLRPLHATIAFSYRLHVEAGAMQADRVPLVINPAWKPQGDKLGLLLQYKLNPAFKFEGPSVTLRNVVLFATYEGKASGVQTKPTGTHLKEKHMVYWRIPEVTLAQGGEYQKIVCRIIGEAGVEPKPSRVEARWELSYPAAAAAATEGGISVSKLEEGKGKDKEVEDDPFADTDGAGSKKEGGRWVEVPGFRSAISGKYEAI